MDRIVDAKTNVNILLVDDQPAKLLSYELILAELDETLVKAGSASEALQHLLMTDFAVVLIDVCMPDLDGFELAAMIRQHPRFEKIAIIFVSAVQVNEIDLVKGYAAGAVDYVPVPVVPELLRAKVRVFVDLYRKTRQLEELNKELERRVLERTVDLEKANQDLERRVEERTREREVALAKVHEMQKLESLGQLTGGVAHDFNNLLMAVLANLDLAKSRVTGDARLLRLLDGAIAGAERGATLTKRMLAFARRQELKPEIVDVAELVEGMTEMLTRSLGPTIEIAIEFPHDLPPVEVDPNQLELALLNLALNARDAMPLGGHLKISSRNQVVSANTVPHLSAGDYICLAVSDTGCGMDEATLKQAAEPFFTTKGIGKGTGLGLSMIDGLAAQSGGSIRLISEVGKGTTVEIWLPRSRDGTVIARRTDTAPIDRGRSSFAILVVDDDPMIAEVTAALLEDMDHTVMIAGSGVEALELLQSKGEAIDLLLTDHAMPGMTGMELAARVRGMWPAFPIILASGYAELPSGEALNVFRLAKPYRREDLEACVISAMDGDQQQGKPAAFSRGSDDKLEDSAAVGRLPMASSVGKGVRALR
jgi:signal transduction histidine kinase